jgi:hypothetical protein
MKKTLGIIQSRGLGDIVISLPIARYYHNAGWEIYWPICQEWGEQMDAAAPWVNWIPVPVDNGPFFYDVPLKALQDLEVEETICLYQALTGHPEFSAVPWFQHTKFDQYKYIQAGVPFLHKWKLAECIRRNPKREQDLYDRLVKNPKYVVIHLEGSDHRADFDRSIIPQDWQTIEISPVTDSIWDWLTVLERAQSLILVDSVYANIVDQMGIGDDRYFLPRSHIQLTPVQGQDWTWLENRNLPGHTRVFRTN